MPRKKAERQQIGNEKVSPKRIWAQKDYGSRAFVFRMQTPTPYHGDVVIPWQLHSLSLPIPTHIHPREETLQALGDLIVENQGLLSSISFSFIFQVLSKPLDFKPKSWLCPMFPSEETALVIENRNGLVFLIPGIQVRVLFVLYLSCLFLILGENLDIILCFFD